MFATRKLILISGPPGAGKSTLAHAILKDFRAVLLDKDCVDEPFSPNDRGPHYTDNIEPKVLQALLNLAELNLSVGNHCIIDLPWTHILINSPHWIQKIEELVKKSGAELKVIELFLPEERLRQRIAARGLLRDQVKLTPEGWEVFKKNDHVGKRIGFAHLAVDSSQSLEEYLPKTLEFLGP
jgi:predicted kinase